MKASLEDQSGSTKGSTKDLKKVGPKLEQKKVASYGPISAVLITVFSFLGSQFLAAIFLAFGAMIFGQDANEILSNISNSTITQFLYILIAEILAVYIIWRFLKIKKAGWSSIGLGRKLKVSDLWQAAAVFVIYMISLIIILALVGNFTGINTSQEQDIGFDNSKTTLQLILVFFSLAILPPIAEEITYRGFLYTGLRNKFKYLPSVIMVSFLFGVAHLEFGGQGPLNYVAAIDTFILSMFLVHLREKTGSLWASIIVHSLKNSVAFLFLFVIKISGM